MNLIVGDKDFKKYLRIVSVDKILDQLSENELERIYINTRELNEVQNYSINLTHNGSKDEVQTKLDSENEVQNSIVENKVQNYDINLIHDDSENEVQNSTVQNSTVENKVQNYDINLIHDDSENEVQNSTVENEVQNSTVQNSIVENEVQNSTVQNSTVENEVQNSIVENEVQNYDINLIHDDSENEVQNSTIKNEVQTKLDSEKNVKIYFITGPSGCGKTELAVKIIKENGGFFDDIHYTGRCWIGCTASKIALCDNYLDDGSISIKKFVEYINPHKQLTNVKGRRTTNYEIRIITSVERLERIYDGKLMSEKYKSIIDNIEYINMWEDKQEIPTHQKTLTIKLSDDVDTSKLADIENKVFTKYDIQTINNITLTESSQRKGVIGENTIKSLITKLGFPTEDKEHTPHCCDIWVNLSNSIIAVEIKNKKKITKEDYDKFNYDLSYIKQITKQNVYGLFLSLLTTDNLNINFEKSYISGKFVTEENLKMYFNTIKLIIEVQNNTTTSEDLQNKLNQLNLDFNSLTDDRNILLSNNSALESVILNNNAILNDLDNKIKFIREIRSDFDPTELNRKNKIEELKTYVLKNKSKFTLKHCKEILEGTTLDIKLTKANIIDFVNSN